MQDSSTRIVITGASGWIGRATLELLWNTLGSEEFACRVVAFGSSARPIHFGNGRAVNQRALSDLTLLPSAPTLFLHLAFLTKDKVVGMDEETYRRSNRELSLQVVRALDLIGTTAVFVASSGAAAYADDPAAAADLRLYGALKKADEEAVASWAEKRGRRAVITRIFALSGPHINKHENYALAAFTKDALAGRAISIRADIPVYRSYVAIRELMSLVFAAMLEDVSGVVRFDTGGERLELQRIAETVCEHVAQVPIERPPLRSGKSDDYVSSDATYRQLLSRYGLEHVPFNQQVVETAAFLRAAQLKATNPGDDASARGLRPQPGDQVMSIEKRHA